MPDLGIWRVSATQVMSSDCGAKPANAARAAITASTVAAAPPSSCASASHSRASPNSHAAASAASVTPSL